MNNIHDQPEKMQKVMVSNFFRSYLANQFQKVILQTGFGSHLPITFQKLTLIMQLFINFTKNEKTNGVKTHYLLFNAKWM
jgi:hypothetical protein